MNKHRKRWTIAEKTEIVNYYHEHGVGKASVEYGVSSTSIYKWASILYGETEELSIDKEKQYKRKLKKLEREMQRLKILVADQTLELTIKDELLKKKPLTK